MQLWEQIVSVVVSNGIFATLFVGLFCYQLKDSKRREEKYQKTIEDLTVHLDIIEDVKEDVLELKSLVMNKRSRKKSEKKPEALEEGDKEVV